MTDEQRSTGTRLAVVETELKNINTSVSKIEEEQLRLWNKFDEVQKICTDINNKLPTHTMNTTQNIPLAPEERGQTVGEFLAETCIVALRYAIIALIVGVIIVGAKAALENIQEVEHAVEEK